MATLLDILEKGSETAIKWLKKNGMTVNPDKFQAMVLGRHKQKEKINLKINATSRIQSFLDQKENKALVNTFVSSNFNYCSLVWNLSTKKSAN